MWVGRGFLLVTSVLMKLTPEDPEIQSGHLNVVGDHVVK